MIFFFLKVNQPTQQGLRLSYLLNNICYLRAQSKSTNTTRIKTIIDIVEQVFHIDLKVNQPTQQGLRPFDKVTVKFSSTLSK